MKSIFAAACAVSITAMPAFAMDYTDAMQSYLDGQIATWAEDPVLIDAIVAQNARTADHDMATIEALDQEWRAEVGTGSALVEGVLTNEAAQFLRERVAEAGGMITEVFIMDARGLNVAASDATSDYWQGDEAKFTETYAIGPDAVHFSEIEFDESSQSFQAQISVTLTDPESGAVVGAMTVGVNADALM